MKAVHSEEEAVKIIALLAVVRKMLRAFPAERITPHNLEKELDLLS